MNKLASKVISSMIDKIASDNENNTVLINLIRDDIVGEYNAIRQYEEHAGSFPDGKIKEVLLDIANEEKVHVGELQKLLDMLSPEDNDLAEDGEREVENNMNKSASEIIIGMIEKEAAGSPSSNHYYWDQFIKDDDFDKFYNGEVDGVPNFEDDFDDYATRAGWSDKLDASQNDWSEKHQELSKAKAILDEKYKNRYKIDSAMFNAGVPATTAAGTILGVLGGRKAGKWAGASAKDSAILGGVMGGSLGFSAGAGIADKLNFSEKYNRETKALNEEGGVGANEKDLFNSYIGLKNDAMTDYLKSDQHQKWLKDNGKTANELIEQLYKEAADNVTAELLNIFRDRNGRDINYYDKNDINELASIKNEYDQAFDNEYQNTDRTKADAEKKYREERKAAGPVNESKATGVGALLGLGAGAVAGHRSGSNLLGRMVTVPYGMMLGGVAGAGAGNVAGKTVNLPFRAVKGYGPKASTKESDALRGRVQDTALSNMKKQADSAYDLYDDDDLSQHYWDNGFDPEELNEAEGARFDKENPELLHQYEQYTKGLNGRGNAAALGMLGATTAAMPPIFLSKYMTKHPAMTVPAMAGAMVGGAALGAQAHKVVTRNKYPDKPGDYQDKKKEYLESRFENKQASEVLYTVLEKSAGFGNVMKGYKNLMTGAAAKEQATKTINTINKSDEYLNKAKSATNPDFVDSYTNIAKNLSDRGNEERKILDGIKRKQSLARTGTGAVAGAGVGAVAAGVKNNNEKKKQSKLQAEEGL